MSIDENCPCDAEPFRPLAGESIEFMGPVRDDYIIAISNYRLFATEEEGFYSVSLCVCVSECVCVCTYNN